MPNITTYTTVDEIKEILGITGTSQDALLERLNKAIKVTIDGILGITGLERRSISERVRPLRDRDFFYIREFGIESVQDVQDLDGTSIASGMNFTPEGGYSRRVFITDTVGNIIIFSSQFEIKVNYIAGFRPLPQFEVLDFTQLSGVTITFGATTKTEGVDWTAGVSNAATAASIVTAFTSAVAEASGAIVTFQSTESLTSDAVPAGGVAYLDTMPEDIKLAAALLVGGALNAKTHTGGVVRYSLGSKTVDFRDSEEADEARRVLDTWVNQLKKVTLLS